MESSIGDIMILKVDPEELMKVTEEMQKDTNVYTEEIKKIEKSIAKLKENWGGIDSVAFTNNFSTFVNRMKDIPAFLATLAKECNETNTKYVLMDEKFQKELLEGVASSEQ